MPYILSKLKIMTKRWEDEFYRVTSPKDGEKQTRVSLQL